MDSELDDKDEEEKRTRLIRVSEEEDKIINRIFKIRKDLLFFGAEDVENYDLEIRNKAIEMVWEVYNHYHEILVELGEIDIGIDLDNKDEEEQNVGKYIGLDKNIDDNQILRIERNK